MHSMSIVIKYCEGTIIKLKKGSGECAKCGSSVHLEQGSPICGYGTVRVSWHLRAISGQCLTGRRIVNMSRTPTKVLLELNE